MAEHEVHQILECMIKTTTYQLAEMMKGTALPCSAREMWCRIFVFLMLGLEETNMASIHEIANRDLQDMLVMMVQIERDVLPERRVDPIEKVRRFADAAVRHEADSLSW